MPSRSPKHTASTVRRLKAIVEAGQLLNSSLNLKKVLTVLLDIATTNLHAERGTIYLLDRKQKTLWSRVTKGERTIDINLPLGQGIAGTVAKTGETITLKDAYKDTRFFQGVDSQTGFRTRTMLCTPMRDKNKRIIGVFQILNKHRGFFTREDEAFLAALSIPASLAIENARLHAAEITNQRLERELEVAAEIQQHLLPRSVPQIPGLALAARSIPSTAVGGDFFEVHLVNDSTLALAIADVSGKGLPSALLVSTVQASLKVYLELGLPLVELVSKLNRLIYNNSTSEKFITFVICLYDIPTRTLKYVNAGHNFPFIIRAAGGFEELNSGGTCLGFFEETPYEEGSLTLLPGDVLLLYTDGVTEAMNRKGDLFGEARLYSTLSSLLAKDARSIQDALLDSIRAFSGGTPQADDITTVLLKIDPELQAVL